MNNKNSKNKRSLHLNIISSLACLVLGIIMVVSPDIIKTALSYIIGIALVVYGSFNIISFFISKDKNLYIEMAIGVITAAVGIFALVSPATIIDIVFYIIGILIIIDSLMDIKHSFVLKAMNMRFWWIYLILSVAVIIIGLITVFFRAMFADMLIIVLGILLIYEGVSGLSILAFSAHFENKNKTDANIIDVEAVDAYEE